MKKLVNSSPFIITLAIIMMVFTITKVTIEKKAKAKLGGDIEISKLGQSADLAISAYLSMHGRVRQHIMTTNYTAKPFARDTRGNPNHTIEISIKGVPKLSMLYGRLKVKDQKRRRLFGRFRKGKVNGSIVSESLLDELSIKAGEHFYIGDNLFIASAVIENEPDYNPNKETALPRAIIHHKAFTKTIKSRELKKGVTHSYKIKLNKSQNIDEWQQDFSGRFSRNGWSVHNWKEYAAEYVMVISWPVLYIILIILGGLIVSKITRKIPRED